MAHHHHHGDASERLRSALPVWKVLLILFTLTVVASAGYLWWTGSAEPAATTVVTATTSQPSATSSVPIPGLADSALQPPAQTEVTTTTITEPSWKQTAGKWGTKLGVAFLVALILGVMFRVFIKAALGFAAILVVLIVLSGYSGLLSPEKTDAAKTRVSQAVDKIEDGTSKLKDIAMASLPSAAAGLVGFFVGFARR